MFRKYSTTGRIAKNNFMKNRVLLMKHGFSYIKGNEKMKRRESLMPISEKYSLYAKKFVSFCAVAALILAFLMLSYLSVIAFSETTDMNMNNSMLENVEYMKDDIFVGIIFVVLLFLGVLIYRFDVERINSWYILGVSMAFVLVFGVSWVLSSQSAPTHDSLIVSRAAYYASMGDFSYITTDYFVRFPFQLGYIFFTEPILALNRVLSPDNVENYICIEIFNVLCLAVSYFALYMCIKRTFNNEGMLKILPLFYILALPPMLFCTFTYGNIPGFMFAAIALWMLLEIKGDRYDWIFAVLSAFAIGIGVSIKKNGMIIFAAMAIVLVLRIIQSRRWADLICILLCTVSVIGMPAAIQKYYEARTDFDFGQGIPMSSWAAMGLNESYIAPGWYNGSYTVSNFHANENDPERAHEASMEEIKERLEVFREDKEYASDFFSKKIKSQWNEPSFQSIWTNQVRGRYKEMGKLASYICGEGEKNVKQYMNVFQQLTFLLCAFSAIFMIRKAKIEYALLPTVIIGGFLYHLIFEAKSQYSMVYFILMLTLAAVCAERLYGILKKLVIAQYMKIKDITSKP